MRSGLAGLTLRGRAFLAAGLTAIACAVLLGQDSLVRIGALAVLLPLVTAYVVGRRRYQLQTARILQPALARAGETVRVSLEVSNRGGNGAGALLMEDQVPLALGARPRFVLQGLRREWRRTVSYSVRSDVRGEYSIGPLRLTANDPFGLLQVRTTVPGSATLTVMPRTVHLPRGNLGGGWGGSGEHRPQAFASGSAEDVTVREYRRGDELRRVHWHSSAHAGQLMVRKEEQPWEARATVLLDNRVRSHRGRGLASSFEFAVTAAASLVAHLDEQGYAVQLATADSHGPAARGGAAALLERLAVLGQVNQPSFTTQWSSDAGTGGLVVAVLGSVDDEDVAALRQWRHHHATALALTLDVDQWAGRGPDPSRRATAPLIGAGWRGAEVGPDDRLDRAWLELTSKRGRRTTAGATR
ncbi:DUF58 domain-containing protein [Nocardioides panacisoli]|uniref:DUF58 domain-containing protein n=1 Tax=Nocardioides panacisoli TaxID=627624 RepID=UPI001C639BCB|nr:DUF58 domain-containing protein [Nocardioides panacisoli]QYJ04731.1 DUF58 domain-containing protein [Nocardioides panacisoli]